MTTDSVKKGVESVLHQKEKIILQYLMDNPSQYITSMELATHLSCSDRTVRNYLKNLIVMPSDETGWEIIAKQGYGYQLVIVNKELYQDFLQKEVLLEASPETVEGIEDRYNYILNKLLFEQEQIYFDDLVDELYVSRSTLSSDFKKIRQDLAKYDVQIESKPKRGVYVTGDERNIRRFIIDFFFHDKFFQVLHNCIKLEVSGRPISLEELTIIVLDECREGKLKLSDFVIQNLVIHIALSLKRMGEGFHIKQLDSWSMDEYVEEGKIAEKILKRVYQSTGFKFPKEEVDYITLHLISKGSFQTDKCEKEDLVQEIRKQLWSVLDQSNFTHEYPFKNDFQLIEGLVAHLSTFFIRLKNHVKMDNPLLAEIQGQYAGVMEMTGKLLSAMPLFSEEKLSDDEVAYVALHFMASLERLKEKQKFNILVICATGYGSAQMLKNRIDNELGNLVRIVDVIGYYEINDERLKNIDFIISSIDLSNLVFNIPVFTVSIFLNSDEIREIKHKISLLKPIKNLNLKPEVKTGSPDQEKKFDDYFSPDYFSVLKGVTKDQVISTLLQKMAQGEEEQFVPQMKSLIEQREGMSSIVFSESIAVPHPIKAYAKNHKIGVALIPEGVAWSQEYPDIKLVFLPSPSIYGNEDLSSLTSKIVLLLEQEELQKQMINCQSFTDFKKLFLSI